MEGYAMALYGWTGWIVQFAVAFGGFAALLSLARSRPTRWRIGWKEWRQRRVPPWFLKLWQADRESVALQERRSLLAGCGLRIDPGTYLAFRRLLIAACAAAAGWCLGSQLLWGWFPAFSRNAVAISALLAGTASFDGSLLHALRRYRTERIRLELSAVASQLLYYTGSRLHLHGKLMRCLPLTRLIRSEWSLLLNEWYHDPDRSLRRFKERLGTDEAYGFAESIRSLRLHESEEVYDLLRAMVREYKDKIALAKESRKESASYVLFVLAGIPILYTFQIFLYPWVQEAAKLFDALNP